jgi:PHD/YefM family antitoxin component YafN of YafNO toxin-antitoxin module
MSWNIAQAKQQFSELVRLSAKEPQAIYNRDTPVATLVNAEEFAQFERWRAHQQSSSLLEQFEQARLAVKEANEKYAGPDFAIEAFPSNRTFHGRANAFDEMLSQEAKITVRKKA